MGKLYKRTGSPFYYGVIGQRRFSTGTIKKADAQVVLSKKEQELWENRFDLTDNSGKSIDEFFGRYLPWVDANRRYHTFRSYQSTTKTFRAFLQSRGLRKMRDINALIIEDYIMERLKVNKRWSVNNHIIVLKAVLNKAREWRYVHKNPVVGIKRIEVNDSKPIKALSAEECAAFLRVCQAEFPEYYAMYFACMVTGMRSGELFNLEWTDIDFARDLIYIQSKPGFAPKGKTAKNNKAKERMLPLHPVLKEMLVKMPKSKYVFTDHGEQFSRSKPRRLLIRIAKLAGIVGLTRLHELRHTYASILLSKGMNIFALKELLGHSDIRDTQKYSHMLPEHFAHAVQLVAKIDVAMPNCYNGTTERK